ncbi:MAG: hypothetical protein M4D80_33950 [Myxococcota bacterium]|nr:hypothetical protein [Myxococcota bacterium]
MVLGAGYLLFIIYAYPGFTSPDSIQQLDQARRSTYGDWHPPMMAVLWHYCDKIWTGTFLMLVLQSATFLVGVDGILRRFLTPTRAAIAAVLVLLFPPVMTTMAVIWKDSQMAGYVLAGTACMLSPRYRWKIVGCFLLFLATAVRHNALAATLPIVVILFVWRDSWTGWRRYALAFGVWIAITGAASVANKLVTDHKDFPWHNSVALFDIAGTVRFSNIKDDAKLVALLEGVPLYGRTRIAERVRKVYSPTGHYWLTHEPDRVFDLPSVEQMDSVKSAWLRIITKHPGAFIVHRMRVFRDALGASERDPAASVWHGDPFPESTTIQKHWVKAVLSIRKTFIFRVWIYFVLSLALIAMCRSRLPLAILLSGLTCELSLLAAAPSPDYRYSHWLVACTVVAGIIVFIERYRARDVGKPIRDAVTSSPASV